MLESSSMTTIEELELIRRISVNQAGEVCFANINEADVLIPSID